jgi:hypothetical protein
MGTKRSKTKRVVIGKGCVWKMVDHLRAIDGWVPKHGVHKPVFIVIFLKGFENPASLPSAEDKPTSTRGCYACMTAQQQNK